MNEIAAILRQLTDKAMALAPEVIEGLVKIQAAKFALYVALWWKFLLVAFVQALATGLFCVKVDEGAFWVVLSFISAVITIICIIVGFTLLGMTVIDKPIFEAAPEVYVLRSLF